MLTRTHALCTLAHMKKNFERFQMVWSAQQRQHVEEQAGRLGISMVDYVRRLVDADREKPDGK